LVVLKNSVAELSKNKGRNILMRQLDRQKSPAGQHFQSALFMNNAVKKCS